MSQEEESLLADQFVKNYANVQSYPYKSATEFATAVNQWLWQCYHWQCFALTYPYYLGLASSNGVNSSGAPDLNRNLPNPFLPNQNVFTVTRPSFGAVRRTSEQQGGDFIIPPLWKRFVAEVIDFCILLVIKVMITYVAVDFFDLIDLDKYDFDLLKSEKIDYHKAMEVTSEIISLEIIHRFVVCIFEAICLHKGVLGAGGSTPGKNMMKLKVISCHTTLAIDQNKVRVYPAGDLGFGWALLRAFIKNFSLAFIFPICFTMFFFQHNRTAYDVICNSIVVEDVVQSSRRRN